MFTKAYLFTLKSIQAYVSGHSLAILPRKDSSGSQKYIGATQATSSSPNITIPYATPNKVTSVTNPCVTFSDDATPFVDDDTVYRYTTPSEISSITYLNTTHAITNNGYSITIRYSVQNGGSQSVTLRKFVAYNQMKYSSTLNAITDSYTSSFLSLVQEITPVTIPAGGTAIIDVTIDTEIPE